ncbi:MAG: peptidylprolyl isomerase [Defluviitaleaceae bacterium]|nr:peptidylprolyl isomerase [Defluviitaleaceae bacterium]
MKKFLLLVIIMTALAACADENINEGATGMDTNFNEEEQNEPEPQREALHQLPEGTIYDEVLESPAVMLQLTPLNEGEELMVLHTTHGDITLRFFPGEAPLAVENFVTHARNGYYDGLIFHRVIPGFMIQGGCPMGTGRGGESIWGEGFGLERSFNLLHFRGALATAHAGPNTIGSQFYIVQSDNLAPQMQGLFEHIIEEQNTIFGEFPDGRQIYVRDIHPAEGMRYFIENGGTPWLDWHWNEQGYGHTVFGHVVSGMDVVDSIANTEATSDRPVEDVIIESVSFKYHAVS